jgi:hypothetical protein
VSVVFIFFLLALRAGQSSFAPEGRSGFLADAKVGSGWEGTDWGQVQIGTWIACGFQPSLHLERSTNYLFSTIK